MIRIKSFIFAASFLAATSSISAQIKTRSYMDNGDKWGIIDENLKVVIPAEYLSAGEFTGKCANVEVAQNKWALVDINNKEIIRFTCDKLKPMKCGWCLMIGTDGKYSFVNEKGEYLVKDAVYASEFSQGLAGVTRGSYERIDYIKPDGTVAFSIDEAKGHEFHNGLALVENIFESYGIIDKTGKFLTPTELRRTSYLGEGAFLTEDPENHYHYMIINKYGKILSPKNIVSATKVYNGISYLTLYGHKNFNSYAFNLKTRELSSKGLFISNNSSKYMATFGKFPDGKTKFTLCDSSFNPLCDRDFEYFGDEVNDIFVFLDHGKNIYVNTKGKTFVAEKANYLMP